MVLMAVIFSLAGSLALAGSAPYLEARAGDDLVRVQPGAAESATIGSYAVRWYRHSVDDFTAGTVAVRDGELAALWLVDLDRDGGREVLVWLRSGGSGSYGRVDRYHLDSGSLVRDDLPAPDPVLLEQYMGHDTFTVEDGVLLRSFPLYRPTDSNAAPTGGTRTLVFEPGASAWSLSTGNSQ